MKARTFFGPAALVCSAVAIGQLNASDASGGGSADGGVAGVIGADVVYTNIAGTLHYGSIAGIHAYALGSDTCNIGDQNLLWLGDGTPGLAMNAYRLHDGRLVQIGQSWVKTACCAAAFPGCGPGIACTGGGGSVLGAGCKDTYSASWNGIQNNLSPRSGINPFTGTFSSIPGGSFDLTSRRLQIAEADMSAITYPGALYFAEGQYIGTDDATNGNEYNNASYRRVTIDGGFNFVFADAMQQYQPALKAWKDNGLGLGVPDPAITIQDVFVPDEGRFVVGSRVKDNGDGTWTYDYAIYNFNSHRAAGTLNIPVANLLNVTGVGFHDVNSHSGEPFDNTNWNSTESGGQVTWSSPQTFAANPNSNALRWGTMYNFWFTANVGPAPKSTGATLGLFKPGTPDSIFLNVPIPANPADLNGDGQTTGFDLALLLGDWGRCVSKGAPGACPADLDGNGVIDGLDLSLLLGEWG